MQDDAAEPIWLSAADIQQINKRVVLIKGENHRIMSAHLLESAVARPRNMYVYDDVKDVILLGVRLIEAIGKNHCFEQGNKRTAWHAGLLFMRLNDEYFDLPDTEAHAELVEGLITGDAPAEKLVALLKRHRLSTLGE